MPYQCTLFNLKLDTMFFRYAVYVSVGDEVLEIQRNDGLMPAKVINIGSFNMQDTFNPLLHPSILCLLFYAINYILPHYSPE